MKLLCFSVRKPSRSSKAINCLHRLQLALRIGSSISEKTLTQDVRQFEDCVSINKQEGTSAWLGFIKRVLEIDESECEQASRQKQTGNKNEND
ncbi:hypothetical protein TNCV_3611591 [Trichonephila clavipes]|nr:hypothetical protein TNCV_3611591 [Trichonephila clavipes]